MNITYKVKYKSAIVSAAVVTCATGCIVIIGWFTGNEALKSILPHFVSMKFNTAICFVLISLALIIELTNAKPQVSVLSKILATVVSFFGLISFLQLLGYNFAIDEIFVEDTVARLKGEHNPGRMSPLTAFCFACSGLAILLLKLKSQNLRKLYQLLLHMVTLVASVALLGYMFSVPNLYNYSFPNSMALHTSVLFIIFSLGATMIHPNTGIAGLFTGTGIGNIMARKLIMWIVPAVLISSYLRNALTNSLLIPNELSLAMLSISFLLISIVCIWITSKELNKIAHKEQQLQENFQMSIEVSPYALILSNNKGEIIHANYKTEKLFGYAREELIGKYSKDLIPEELRNDLRLKRERFFLNEKTIHYNINDKIYCQDRKGKKFPVEIIITPVKTTEDTLALSSIIDITERKQSEEIMQKQLMELQQKNQEMEQFSFVASHDLQEPLRTVSNYIMLLEEDYPEQINGEVKEHLGNINEAVVRMKKLIRNLLDFSRLGRNKRLAHTDIKIVLKEVVADLKGLLDEKAAIVRYNPNELPAFYAYELELRLLFQNLINNAVKFSKKNTPPVIEIYCRTIDGYYEFSVADNGIGMDEKHLNDIFNIFQRLHTNEEYEGYGIGLAHCKKIAEMHGGKIWVESVPGKGSTFKFTILNLK